MSSSLTDSVGSTEVQAVAEQPVSFEESKPEEVTNKGLGYNEDTLVSTIFSAAENTDIKLMTKFLVSLDKDEIDVIVKMINLIGKSLLQIPSNKVLEFPFSESCSARFSLTENGLTITFFVNGVQQMNMELENELYLFKAAIEKMNCQSGFSSYSRRLYAEQKLRSQIFDIVSYENFNKIADLFEAVYVLKDFNKRTK